MIERTQGKVEKEIVGLLGLGLDESEGHKRVTTGSNFILFGGSADTHEQMIDTAIHVNEGLKRKGKTLQDADPEELLELLREAAAKGR